MIILIDPRVGKKLHLMQDNFSPCGVEDRLTGYSLVKGVVKASDICKRCLAFINEKNYEFNDVLILEDL